MRKILHGILIICILFLITGCGSKPVEDTSDIVDENKEFYSMLNSVVIPNDYQFKQVYVCSWSGGIIEKDMSGRFVDRRLVEFHKINIFYGYSGYKDEKKSSCKSYEECKPLYENVNLSDEISLRETSLSIDRIINILKNKFQPEEDIYFAKVSLYNSTCFSYYSDFMVCFNDNDELIYYEDYGGYCGNQIKWTFVGYELDTDQMEYIKHALETIIYDIETKKQLSRLKDCGKTCEESLYMELINYLGNPSEDCFKANESTDTGFSSSEFGKEVSKKYVYFCNEEYIQYLLFSTYEETGKIRIRRNSTSFEKNPEQMQKGVILNLLEIIYLEEKCPKEKIEKIVLDNNRTCFKIEKTEACDLYWLNKLIACFNENYLINYYSEMYNQRKTWEKEQHPFAEELIQ